MIKLIIIYTFLVAFSYSVYRTSAQDLLSSAFTLSLDGIPYYIPGKPIASGYVSAYATCISGGTKFALGLVPVTVVTATSTNYTLSALERVVKAFGNEDDVWGKAFMSGKDPRSSSEFSHICPV